MREEQGRREPHVTSMARAQPGVPFPLLLVSSSAEVEGSVREQGGQEHMEMEVRQN